MSWDHSVLLKKDEKVVASWKGVWITTKERLHKIQPKETEKNRKEKATEKKKGYLVLTTRRLLFIDQEQTMIDVDLTKFANLWMDRTPTEVEGPDWIETNAFRLEKVGKKEFDRFKELILYHSQRQIS
jgi:predicted nucleotidyltransferase